jgi:hypothetical protein
VSSSELVLLVFLEINSYPGVLSLVSSINLCLSSSVALGLSAGLILKQQMRRSRSSLLTPSGSMGTPSWSPMCIIIANMFSNLSSLQGALPQASSSYVQPRLQISLFLLRRVCLISSGAM